MDPLSFAAGCFATSFVAVVIWRVAAWDSRSGDTVRNDEPWR